MNETAANSTPITSMSGLKEAPSDHFLMQQAINLYVLTFKISNLLITNKMKPA